MTGPPMQGYIRLATIQGEYLVSPRMLCRLAYNAAYYRHLNSSDGWEQGLEEPFPGSPRAIYTGSSLSVRERQSWDNFRIRFDFDGAHRRGAIALGQMSERLMTIVSRAATPKVPLTAAEDQIGPMRRELRAMERRMQRDHREMRERMTEAQRAFQQGVLRRVQEGERGVAAARLVRDLSADAFIVCAGLLSGGTALAGLATGSVARGAFKYQDTQNFQAAIMQTTTSFTVGVIPVPGAQQTGGRAQYYVMVFIRGKAEATGRIATGLIEGKTLANAAVDTAASMLGSAAAGGLGRMLGFRELGPITEWLGETAIPVDIRARVTLPGSAVARLLADRSTDALATAGADQLVEAVRRALAGAEPAPTRTSAPLANPFLAELAIIGPGPDRSRLPWDYN